MLRWCQAVRNTPATPNYILILVLLLLQYNESDFKDRKHILILLVLNTEYHDDVIKWKHFPRYWPFVRGIRRSPANSVQKMASDAELWSVLWSAHEQTIE